MMDFFKTFSLAALATWRLTHLLALEDGPGDVIAKLRAALGDGFLGSLLDCFYCLSLWIAAPAALLVARDPMGWALSWLALSGAACLLERLGQTESPPESFPSPPIIYTPGDDHVLR